MNESKEFFCINVSKYDSTKNYNVVRPSSLSAPKNNSVMFVTEGFLSHWRAVLEVENCLVIWPENIAIPDELSAKHVVLLSPEPRYGFAQFFYDNNVTYNTLPKPFDTVNGAYICNGAKIGKNTVIFPGAYIDSDVTIGDNCYIASGVKIVGSATIGNDCIIRENTVIGSDGLTTRRDATGKVITIPQFGGVTIEDNVQIGANSVVCKGAIDNTVIGTGSRIDNQTFISHNVHVGKDTLIVGESLMMGSSSTGERVFISGNSVIRDGVHIGDDAFIGMGSVVVKPVPDKAIVKGNPAK
ncbi:MAG: hypothetical protein MJ130_05625 [Lachnospiraceae bacterium]|nr:hypothetical protein [Lachnospiraceae bacterium]